MRNFPQNPLLGTLPNYASPRSKGVISNWLFSERSGSQLTDSFLNRNDGAITGATWLPRGLGFGGSDFVVIPNESQFDFTGIEPFTMLVWFKTSTNISQAFFDKFDGSRGYFFGMGLGPSAILRWVHVGTGSSAATSTAVFGDGNIHCYMITSNGTGISVSDYVMYADGNSIDFSPGGTITGGGASTVNAYIGARQGSSQFFTGTIYKLAVYNSTVSADEATQECIDPHAMFKRLFGPVLFGALAAVVGRFGNRITSGVREGLQFGLR